jgi:tyrosyl-DNA phosphodiesterase-1
LSDELLQYDFSAVQAAFIGSAPSKQIVNQADSERQTSFGWLGLQEILSKVPIAAQKIPTKSPHVVVQVSSIATLGAAPTWLSNFQSALARSQAPQQSYIGSKPNFNIIFPTPEDVRTSLDGYESGGSIHTKVQSAQQQKQLQYLHPLFCHWKHPPSPSPSDSHQEAHRGPAAPHIKTYIRLSNDTHKSVDWALLTSANLSKQAWGDVVNKQGEVRIQSYETGVLIWPELFAEPGIKARIVPVFGKDMPAEADVLEPPSLIGAESVALHRDGEHNKEEDRVVAADDNDDDETEDESEEVRLPPTKPSVDKGKAPVHDSTKKRIFIGLRMPYDLPLSPYSATDKPWCATQQYTEPDWKGRVWGGW